MSILRWLTLAALSAVLPVVQAADAHLSTDLQRLSYMIGLQVGQNIAKQGFTELDPSAFALAVQDALNGTPPRVTADQARAAQENYRKALQARQQQTAKDNLQKGQEFLAGNAKAEGVITLDSGVQYRVLKEGNGATASVEDTVVVHYQGTMLTGVEFDSSYSRGEPLTFALGQVITGWQQVVSRMKAGAMVEAWIPAEHAYGTRGSPPNIGPNETLYFKIELLEVKGK